MTIRIATDAPADQLRVPESVSAEYGHRLAVPVGALADDVPGEPEATYTVSLASGGDLPPWIELSDEPIRVTVLDSPGAACEDLRVEVSLARTSGTMRRGTFRIQAAHPDTSMSWEAPYVDRTSSRPIWRTVAPHVFPERLLLRPLGTGFEQEVRLRWWDGDLRLTVQAPGCERSSCTATSSTATSGSRVASLPTGPLPQRRVAASGRRARHSRPAALRRLGWWAG